MSSQRHDNYEIRAPKPIDTRMTVATFADLALLPVQYRYQGLTAFVTDAQQEYWLRDGIADLDWIIKTGSGGGGGSTIQNDQYENQGVVNLPVQPNLKFGQPFQVADDAVNNATTIEDTIFASFVDDGLVTTSAVGGIPAGTSAADLKGDSITSLFNQIFFPLILPSYTLSSMSTSGTGTASVERGENVARSITSTFNQNDYGQGSNYVLTWNASSRDSDAGPFVGNGVGVGSQPYALADVIGSNVGDTGVLNANITYDNAPAKNDNYGNPDPSPPLGGQINNTTTYTARYPVWWASYTLLEIPDSGGGVPTIDETIIKGGDFADKQLFVNPELSSMLTPASGDNWMIAFCPPGTSVTFAKDEANNIPFNSMLVDSIVVTVTDAGSNIGTEVNYNVHYYFSPGGFSGSQTVTIKVDN